MNKKTALPAALFLVLLFSALFAEQFDLIKANFMQPLPELPHVYIKNDGSIEPQTLPIQRAGDSYIFNGNLSNRTIEVQRGNIFLTAQATRFKETEAASE